MAVKVKRVLISVSNKQGIVEFAKILEELDVEVISTGGTYRALKEGGIGVLKVEEITGFPEMLNGRVKTLHPFIHGGILADRSNRNHIDEVLKAKIKLIDMVVVNLYPFKETISRADVIMEEAIENIDIGGPTMIRSAAKNYKSVAVIVDPQDYKKIAEELKKGNGQICDSTLFCLSVKAFQHTCEYDSVIFGYFAGKNEYFKDSNIDFRHYLEIGNTKVESEQIQNDSKKEDASGQLSNNTFRNDENKFRDTLNLKLTKLQDLRYGENPHQKGAYYKFQNAGKDSFANCKQLQGKELSYNNILDSNAAFGIAKEFKNPCVSVIKHNNPCGAAISDNVLDAYQKAYECDPVSAFGSVVASNIKWTADASEFLMDKYVEVLIAPDFEGKALEILSGKKNLRILKVNFNLETYINTLESDSYEPYSVDLKSVDGGMLLQDFDSGVDKRSDMKVITTQKPDSNQWEDIIFGWQIAKSVKSNAIVLVKGKRTVGVGAGQMSRIDAAKIAVEKAGSNCNGSILASDAFFPFKDTIEFVAPKGITAIIQPGGSVRDSEVIECCNKNGISMIFTGKRHFRH